MLVNAIKALVAQRLTESGEPPDVLTGAAIVGADEAARLFESAYDEHARRLAKLSHPNTVCCGSFPCGIESHTRGSRSCRRSSHSKLSEFPRYSW